VLMRMPWKVLILAICLLVVLPLALGACGGGGGGGDALLGTWTDSTGVMEYEFKSDGTLLVTFMGEEQPMNYSVKDDTLTLKDEETGEEAAIDYTIEGDNLKLSFEGDEETLVRKK